MSEVSTAVVTPATNDLPVPTPPPTAPPVPSSQELDQLRDADDGFVVQPVPGRPTRGGKVARYDGCSLRDWNLMLQQRAVPEIPVAAMRRIGKAEIRQHAEPTDLWMVIRGIVYDCSSWCRFHPGGVDTLMEAAGRDGTALFEQFHRWVACEVMMAPFIQGVYDNRL
jgi:hypothetical protein